MMEAYVWLSIPVLIFTAWFYTATVTHSSFPTLREKAIVLLIAHPDDEAMFFAPTVLALTDPGLGNHVKILCLSNGNADGLGAIREKEIQESAVQLGLRSKSDVLVLDSPEFPDSMKQRWSSSDISDLLQDQFAKRPSKSSSGSRGAKQRLAAGNAAKSPPQETTIDVLITFDRDGVSSHPNHCSLYHGAVAWVQSLVKGKAGWDSPVQLYTLTSVNILRKYSGVFEAPWTLLTSLADALGSKNRGSPDRIVFVNGPNQYWSSRGAMTQAHKSQMVWFRWAWISLGRYMVTNDLMRHKLR